MSADAGADDGAAVQVATGDNVERGRMVEICAATRWPMVLVDDDRAPDWYDLATTSAAPDGGGSPVEAKGCRVTVGRAGRHGRFWIRRRCHDRLVAAGGLYVLAIYDAVDELQAVAAIDAAALDDELAGRWTSAGKKPCVDECAQIDWRQAFEAATGVALVE